MWSVNLGSAGERKFPQEQAAIGTAGPFLRDKFLEL